MTSRIDSPDTPADFQLRALLDRNALTSFVMIAGAGSGKTTSLIKGLSHLIRSRGRALRSQSQRIACITYTEVAAQEIHSEIGLDPLVDVSTIHSFLWELAKPFQRDIAEWTRERVEGKISALTEKQANYGKGTRSSTITKDAAELEKLQSQRIKLESVSHFTYEFGSDYSRGILGHEDILNLAPDLIAQKPLLAQIVASKFPYIFVDESQDTFTNVVDSLKLVQSRNVGRFSLGFFGDPMQQIFQRSTGIIVVEDDWVRIEKPENFRSSVRVLEIVNQIREPADGLVQTPGGSPNNSLEGEAFFFVLPADDNRSEYLERARAWLDSHSSAGSWTASDPREGAKILMIVHRMAAKRMGFESLYSAFADSGSVSLREAFDEGTAWPLRPFFDVILPIASALNVDDVAVISAIRRHSALLVPDLPPDQVRINMRRARSVAETIREVVAAGGPGSLGAALKLALEGQIAAPDPRLDAYFQPTGEHADVVLSESDITTLNAMAACDVRELDGYMKYINGESPYSTQHGTKGAEFRKVVVVLDDEEGRYSLYSYDKLFGIKPLSETDKSNQSAGVDSALERTRRLLYVCVSRAIESLAVVMYAADVEVARVALLESGICGNAQILTLSDI